MTPRATSRITTLLLRVALVVLLLGSVLGQVHVPVQASLVGVRDRTA